MALRQPRLDNDFFIGKGNQSVEYAESFSDDRKSA